MAIRFFSTVVALAALSACGSPGPDHVSRLGASPALTGGTYSTGGGITIASGFHEIKGHVGLCGVWSESDTQTTYTKGKARDILASGAAYLQGDRLLSGLTFLRKTAPGSEYAGLQASCAVTARPWRAEYATRAPDIRLPGQVVHRDHGIGASPIVRFRQTGPASQSKSLDLVDLYLVVKTRMTREQAQADGT